MNGGANADHVGDRVPGADLVKVDALDVDAVGSGLGGRERGEHGQRLLSHAVRQVCLGDQGANRRPVAVVVVGDQRRPVDLGRAQTCALHRPNSQSDGIGQDRLDREDHGVEGSTGVQ